MSNSPQGFKDDSNGDPNTDLENDYDYDLFGNMTKDQNKNITNIKYNHLNLPIEIDFSNNRKITYTYDASGVKLQKQVLNNLNITITDYVNGFQYETLNAHLANSKSKLQFFPTAEGYVKAVYLANIFDPNPTPTFQYVYNYTDHLGNIRLSYTADKYGNPRKLDETHYYPFGLRHGKYNQAKKKLVLKEIASLKEVKAIPTVENSYKYKYNGKELQDELGLNVYDYGARYYTADAPHFPTIDPLAEKFYSQSPYVYAANNPVYFIDKNGMEPDKIIYGNLKGKEKRRFKRTIKRSLKSRMKSKTFRKLFRNLKKSELTYNFTTENYGNGYVAAFVPTHSNKIEMEEDSDGMPIPISQDPGLGGGKIHINQSEMSNNSLLGEALSEEIIHANQFEYYVGNEDAKKYDYHSWSGSVSVPSGNLEFEAKMIAGVVNNEAHLPFFSGYGATGFAQKFGVQYQKGNNAFGINISTWKSKEMFLETSYGSSRFGIDSKRSPNYFNYLFK